MIRVSIHHASAMIAIMKAFEAERAASVSPTPSDVSLESWAIQKLSTPLDTLAYENAARMTRQDFVNVAVKVCKNTEQADAFTAGWKDILHRLMTRAK